MALLDAALVHLLGGRGGGVLDDDPDDEVHQPQGRDREVEPVPLKGALYVMVYYMMVHHLMVRCI